MALIASDPTVTRPYSLKGDTDDPTIFQLGTLDPELLASINDSKTSFQMNGNNPDEKAEVTVNIEMRNISIVRYGLRGWSENFVDTKGKTVPVLIEEMNVPNVGKRTGLKRSCLQAFRPEWINELASAILATNKLTEQQEKNSVALVN